jgi:hypothetical protein
MKRLICIFLCLCWFLPALATESDQLYQIEIVIFSHITPEGLRSEYWPPAPPQITSPHAVALTDEQIIPKSQWTLTPLAQLLTQNHDEILLQTAWIESATNLRKGKIVYLNKNLPQVDGLVAILLNRFFSVHVNLKLSLPWNSVENLNLTNVTHDNKDPNLSFQLNEKLRMRSNELNYLDHPLFGVLIKVLPLPISGATANANQ